ncbi:hypothetical protein [Actinocorallia populi]|uniref:hypothetical protein n=1 Tax=Actinocorallia populi TaxID=2079200 RepID=UPI000D097186|nr:hypothetical protein [Actinocorallia populi]
MRTSEANRPFRWDLIRADRLGTLLDGVEPPDLWFLDELVECAAKVVSRSAGGDLYLVGRSPDSVFDLLSGAFSGTSRQDRMFQLPLSLYGRSADDLDAAERDALRANLAAQGLSPDRLAHRRGPVVLADLVSEGSTFENLFTFLARWADDDRILRRSLRFVGITGRRRTSPRTWRWHQHAGWTDRLPARSVTNVSISGRLWDYLGNTQTKLTPSFHRKRWQDEKVRAPRHDLATRTALAEAVALTERGRSTEVRARLARVMASEPTRGEPWLRSLIAELNRPAAVSR